MSTKRNDKEGKKSPPPYAGVSLPKNPKNFDDMGEETTRRAVFSPSFNPTASSVQIPRGYPEPAAPAFQSVMYDTLPQKVSAQAQITQKEQTSHYPPPVWPLADAPTLPEFYPLERTAVFVPNVPPAKVQMVADRVSNVLRERSIEATYDSERAKAKCITAENVDFRVRLYRGKNRYSHGVIVEVQRRFGFSVNFHNDTIAILDAAEGKATKAPPPMEGLPYVSDSDDDYDPSQSVSSLDFVSKMLNQPAPDSHSLALQTLATLTDGAKIGRETAQVVSKALLAPGNEVGARVLSFVEDDKADPEETFGLRLMATTVLSNSIHAVSGDIPQSLKARLRPTLISILRDATTHPQMAYLAARSIEFLIMDDPNPIDLYGPLEAALVVGEARHAALAREANVCLKNLRTR